LLYQRLQYFWMAMALQQQQKNRENYVICVRTNKISGRLCNN
jgi:hypothetical protein